VGRKGRQIRMSGVSTGRYNHGLKEQFTPYYRSDSYKEVPRMTDSDSRRSTGVLSVVGLLAMVVSLVMIVMGILHAAPIDGERGADGVVQTRKKW